MCLSLNTAQSPILELLISENSAADRKSRKKKKKIFNALTEFGVAVIPQSDDFAEFLAKDIKGKIVWYGKDVKNNGIEFISDDGIDGTTFKVDGQVIHLAIPGAYNYNNALAAVELGRSLGLSALQIKNGIEKVKPLSGRSHILKEKLQFLKTAITQILIQWKRQLNFQEA